MTSTHEHPPADRVRSRAGCLIVALLGMFILCGGAWWILGPVIPAKTLVSLRAATQADVRRVLGEPTEVMEHGDWIYRRRGNPGWVAIAFDGEGRVWTINDEQVDPVTFGSGSWEPSVNDRAAYRARSVPLDPGDGASSGVNPSK